MNKILNYGPGIIFGLPSLGRPVPLEWAFAFKNLNPPINFNSIFHYIHGKEIGDARQEMALTAIEKKSKYLFFIGDDVVIPNHALRLMIYLMEQRPDIGIIGGVYCAKADPAFPLVFQGNGQGSYWDWKIGEFFEVTGLGMDCTLIRVSVLEELQSKDPNKRLFETVKSDKFLEAINTAEEWTEDLYFFNRVAKETNWKIYCHGGIICDHWDVYSNKKYTLPADSLPMRQKVVDSKLKKLLDIGSALPPQNVVGFDIVTVFDSSLGEKALHEIDYRSDYTSLPFDDCYFDAVNTSNVFTNLKRIPEILREIDRVLKPAGEAKITYSNMLNKAELELYFTQKDYIIIKSSTSLLEVKKYGKTENKEKSLSNNEDSQEKVS